MSEHDLNWYDHFWSQYPPSSDDIGLARLQLVDIIDIYTTTLTQLSRWDQALAILQKMPHLCYDLPLVKQSRIQYHLAGMYRLKGDYALSLELNQQAADALENEMDEDSQLLYGEILGAMGIVYTQKGNYQQALHCFKALQRISEAFGNQRSYGRAAGFMGILYTHIGDFEQAIQNLTIEKDINEQLGDKRAYAITVGNIGNVYRARHEYDRALACYSTMQQTCLEIGDKYIYGAVSSNMGNIYLNTGDYDRAMRLYSIFKHSCEETGDEVGYSVAVSNMGMVYMGKGDYERALACLKEQRTICEKHGEKRYYSYAQMMIGEIYIRQGNFEQALACYDEAITLNRELTLKALLGESLYKKANLQFIRGYYDEAARLNTEALTVTTEIGDVDITFDIQILAAKLDWHMQTDTRHAVISRLESMLSETDEPERKAMVHYELFQLIVSSKPLIAGADQKQLLTHKAAALELYQKLYEKTPKFEYKQRIEELRMTNDELVSYN